MEQFKAKNAKITVVTKSGRTLKFEASEAKSDSGYGRDIYVGIDKITDKGNREHFQTYDCRYVMGYRFDAFLKECFEAWYGENLQSLEIELVEE